MYTFLFLVPKNGTYLQVGYCPTTGASVIPIDLETEKWAKDSKSYKTAQAYSIPDLKILAKKVYVAMQEDSELTVNDVIFEQMDMLDMEIADYQREVDEDAVDDQ